MADNYYWIRLERKVQLNQLKYADEVKEVLWGNGLIPKTAPYAIYEGSYKSNGEWKDAVLVVSKASRRTVLHRCLFPDRGIPLPTIIQYGSAVTAIRP